MGGSEEPPSTKGRATLLHISAYLSGDLPLAAALPWSSSLLTSCRSVACPALGSCPSLCYALLFLFPCGFFLGVVYFLCFCVCLLCWFLLCLWCLLFPCCYYSFSFSSSSSSVKLRFPHLSVSFLSTLFSFLLSPLLFPSASQNSWSLTT